MMQYFTLNSNAQCDRWTLAPKDIIVILIFLHRQHGSRRQKINNSHGVTRKLQDSVFGHPMTLRLLVACSSEKSRLL